MFRASRTKIQQRDRLYPSIHKFTRGKSEITLVIWSGNERKNCSNWTNTKFREHFTTTITVKTITTRITKIIGREWKLLWRITDTYLAIKVDEARWRLEISQVLKKFFKITAAHPISNLEKFRRLIISR